MKFTSDTYAVVTGGSTGMGRQLCIQLASKGVNVATCDIDGENMLETERLCRAAAAAHGFKDSLFVSNVPVDVSERDQMNAFAKNVSDAFGGKLHVLFNNAGISSDGAMVYDPAWDEATIEKVERDWKKGFDVNLWGVVYGIRAFLPQILATTEDGVTQGYVLNTASVNAMWTWPEHTSYSAAKGAVKMLTESLMAEMKLKRPNVTVAVIMPGGIQTQICQKSFDTFNTTISEEVREKIKDTFAKETGNLCTAEEAAHWILDAAERDKTRILVGYDAWLIDTMIRLSPHRAYDLYDAFYSIGVRGSLGDNLEEKVRKAFANPLNVAKFFAMGGWYQVMFLAPTKLLWLRRSNLFKGALLAGALGYGASKL